MAEPLFTSPPFTHFNWRRLYFSLRHCVFNRTARAKTERYDKIREISQAIAHETRTREQTQQKAHKYEASNHRAGVPGVDA